jgi:hypothetical protein
MLRLLGSTRTFVVPEQRPHGEADGFGGTVVKSKRCVRSFWQFAQNLKTGLENKRVTRMGGGNLYNLHNLSPTTID